MWRRRLLLLAWVFLYWISGQAQQTAPLPAPWVSYPSASQTAYGVYHFRRSFDLYRLPEKLVIHVSADNRYNLFVNGQRVCYGPAKGDLQTYKYDVVDIAPYLKKGANLMAALVYNGGEDRPLAFVGAQTAFMLRAATEDFAFLNSSNGWKVYRNPAYTPVTYQEMLFNERWFYGFYACGPGDRVEGAQYPWGWEQPGYDDAAWLPAEPLRFDKQPPWKLMERNIPFMANHRVLPALIRKANVPNLAPGPWDGSRAFTIPANTRASVLIDFDVLTMGYPELTLQGGKSSQVQVKYAEALYEAVHLKAHRDSVNGLTMYGVWDIFHPDGGKRTFRPLWKRTFRYVQFNIETKEEPLQVLGYQLEYSGYPYPDMARFESDDPRLNKIFEMSNRTLQMCSGETYYDTPFYEQLSYGGDNRPIAAISTYNSTDDRLLREVLRLYPQSLNRETGLFKSAYPSRFDFDHGTWSMGWIQTLHDYYFMRGDSAFIKPFLPGIEGVLNYFERYLDKGTGILGTVPSRNFMDWSITKGSVPRSNDKREIIQSALLTLDYAHTLDCSAALGHALGWKQKATYWTQLSRQIKAAVNRNCWDEKQQLFRDYADRAVFSQHTNILAILCDLVPPAQQAELLRRILTWDGFEERASSYFAFFLFKAMEKTGQEDLFLDHLDFWQQFINRGHTTCGETGFASHDRSDCHAWSAHPSYYLLRLVGGIKPGDVGFQTVQITPHLGKLQQLKADMPHPKGRIAVEYQKTKKGLQARIILPAGMSGAFEWGGVKKGLTAGENVFTIAGNP